MKYFLVCFLLIISCKSAVTDAHNTTFVIGTTSNIKGGASLSNKDGRYMIAGLQSWDSIYLGKTVKIKGIFTYIDVKEQEVERLRKIENPVMKTLQAQTFSANYYLVTDAKWELYAD